MRRGPIEAIASQFCKCEALIDIIIEGRPLSYKRRGPVRFRGVESASGNRARYCSIVIPATWISFSTSS
jgi:hypothetical protein